MPRHPPCALKQQTHTNNPTHKQNTHKQKTRCSRPLYSSHTPHPPPPTSPHDQPANNEPQKEQPPTHKHARRHHVLPQTPNSAPMTNHNKGRKSSVPTGSCTPCPHHPASLSRGGTCPPGISQTNVGSTTIVYSTNKHPQLWATKKLLRKEVIQPHLPVRLPCYDFVPIADPTFDSSLTRLGHWLRVLPTFMT